MQGLQSAGLLKNKYNGRIMKMNNISAEVTLEYAFEELGLKAVYMRVFEDNMPSGKNCENAGFKLQEGKYEEIVIDGVKRKVIFMEANK